MARVLVVDDLPEMRKVAAMLVRAAGHEAATADGGARALAVITQDPPDVILLDLSMPEVDGFDVLEALQERERSGNPPISVVVLSALDDEKSRARATALGAAQYLVKGSSTFLDVLRDVTEQCSRSECKPVRSPDSGLPGRAWARWRRFMDANQGASSGG